MTKTNYEQRIIEPLDFHKMVIKLRGFFMQEGYVETYPQPRLSILAACEDPRTVRSFIFSGNNWPLAQTNQMWLERDLMINAKNLDNEFDKERVETELNEFLKLPMIPRFGCGCGLTRLERSMKIKGLI